MKTALIASLAIVMTATIGAGQDQARRPGVPGVITTDAPPARLATGTSESIIRGRVIAALTSEALPNAEIGIRPEPGGTPFGAGTRTNERGEFEVRVPPGRYIVTASRYGFVAAPYGGIDLPQAGQPIEVRSGELVRIDIPLRRAATIQGTVTDAAGIPIQGAIVALLRTVYGLGHKLELPGSEAATNASGHYKIEEIPPGRYRLVASFKKTWSSESNGEILGYARTFFPDTDRAGSETIVVNPGDATTDVNFRLHPRRTATVSGRVERPDGSPFARSWVELQNDFGDVPDGIGVRDAVFASGYADEDGRFEFTAVPPGDYVVAGNGDTRYERTFLPLTVAERDTTGLVLRPTLGSSLTGRVVTEDGQTPVFPRGNARVTVGRGRGRSNFLSFAEVMPDWSFYLSNLKGSYVFRLSQLPQDWVLRTVRLNGTDITDRMWELPPGGTDAGNLEIVITRKAAAISGAVEASDGRPVPSRAIVLFPDDPALWFHESRFIRNGRADARGRLEFKGLPAGRYRIAAVDSVYYEQWWDPEYLARLRPDATRVDVSEGGAATVTIRLP